MKNIKLFEEYTKFINDSKTKYKLVIDDLNDILLELNDNGIDYKVEEYFDDSYFGITISINGFDTKNQKSIVEETLNRLNYFLEGHEIGILKIDFYQNIDGYSHVFDLYEIEELKDLVNTPGLLSIVITFGEYKI